METNWAWLIRGLNPRFFEGNSGIAEEGTSSTLSLCILCLCSHKMFAINATCMKPPCSRRYSMPFVLRLQKHPQIFSQVKWHWRIKLYCTPTFWVPDVSPKWVILKTGVPLFTVGFLKPRIWKISWSHPVMHPYLFHRPLIVRPPCVFVGTVIPSVMLPVHAHLVRGYPSHLWLPRGNFGGWLIFFRGLKPPTRFILYPASTSRTWIIYVPGRE